ncbi:MAG: GNAT family N-acetyltransferase [Chloroflexota bacterium]
MTINDQLFAAQAVCLGPIDHEKDPAVEAAWTHDSRYLRMLTWEPARPLSAAQVKKKYEKIEKERDEKRSGFYFTIRMRADDRLVGFVHLPRVEWNNGAAFLSIGIGRAEDRGRGFGSQALQLALHYAFRELNLYRMTVVVPEYNRVGLRLFEQAGFTREVCCRQALFREGRAWDLIHLGLLRKEWLALNSLQEEQA